MWYVGGGFNVIRRILDKSGGSRLTPRTKDFDEFIKDSKLVDHPLRKVIFTWSNLQELPFCKRLDRFLFSNAWKHNFPLLTPCRFEVITQDFKASFTS